MDELLREFHLNTEYHNNAINHAKEKGMKLHNMNVFHQPQCWDFLTQAIESGDYHTKVTEIHYIDKNTGCPLTYEQSKTREKVREIYVMELMDRVIWNMFYQIGYSNYSYMIHPLCVSYKKGESTRTTACKLNKELTLYQIYDGVKCDLSKFFDSVPIEVIDKWLDKFEKLKPSAIWKVIREFYHDNRVVINGQEVERFGSLKQGCAFACLLADIILSEIDEEMSKYDVTYYRYSDDFILIGREWRKAFKRFKEMLSDLGMKLNDNKTEYISHRNWFTFLGFRFKGKDVTISEKSLKNLTHAIKEATIVQCKKKKRALTKTEIAKAIDDIQYYLFTGCKNHKAGMANYLFGAINVEHDIARIDEYIKDCIMACATNKCDIYGLGCSYGKYGIVDYNKGKNVGMNRVKCLELPMELGWYSLVHMYKKYKTNRNVYEMECLKMNNGYTVELC